MNKIAFALALGTGVVVGLAADRAEAAGMDSTTTTNAPLYQLLSPRDLSAAQFNSMFTAYAPPGGAASAPILSPFRFDGSSTDAGKILSQVFQGTGANSNLYAYAYQVALNNAKDNTDNPVQVDSIGFKFNSTPIGTDLTGAGSKAYSYVVKDGTVGGLNLSGTQAPTSLAWSPGKTTGAIRAMYANPDSQTSPLNAGSNSATFVVITNTAPGDTRSVNIGSTVATTTVPVVYSAGNGEISQIPVPEPATWLVWSGMAAAVALVHRVRRARVSLA